jgi:hypothetical protein
MVNMLCFKCQINEAKFINARDYLDGISRNSFCSKCYQAPVYDPECAVIKCKRTDVTRKTVMGYNDYLCPEHAYLGHDVPEA